MVSLPTTIGERIKYSRRASGYTQITLAERVGVTHGNVSMWETDQTKPRAKIVRLLAEALDVSIEWLEQGTSTLHPEPESVGSWDFRNKAAIASSTHQEVLIPRLDVASQNNYVGEQNYKSTIPFHIDVAKHAPCAPSDLGVMVVSDTLMEPVLAKGDLVVVDTSQNVIRNDENDIYLVRGDKRALALCRIVEDIFGYYLWFERDSRTNGRKISDLQWKEFFIAGRVVYKSGFL